MYIPAIQFVITAENKVKLLRLHKWKKVAYKIACIRLQLPKKYLKMYLKAKNTITTKIFSGRKDWMETATDGMRGFSSLCFPHFPSICVT